MPEENENVEEQDPTQETDPTQEGGAEQEVETPVEEPAEEVEA